MTPQDAPAGPGGVCRNPFHRGYGKPTPNPNGCRMPESVDPGVADSIAAKERDRV